MLMLGRSGMCSFFCAIATAVTVFSIALAFLMAPAVRSHDCTKHMSTHGFQLPHHTLTPECSRAEKPSSPRRDGSTVAALEHLRHRISLASVVNAITISHISSRTLININERTSPRLDGSTVVALEHLRHHISLASVVTVITISHIASRALINVNEQRSLALRGAMVALW